MITNAARERYVYFLRPIGADGPVKIGCSDLPLKRLKEISTWSPLPLEIAATAPGSLQLERNLHDCFADLHSHREWFSADSRLAAFIEKVAAGVPIAEAIDLAEKRGNIRGARSKTSGQWLTTERGKLFMSLTHRLRWACKRAGLTRMDVPESVSSAVFYSREHGITEDQRAEIEAYLAAPFKARRSLRRAA